MTKQRPKTTVEHSFTLTKFLASKLLYSLILFCGLLAAAEQEVTQEELDAVDSAIVEITAWLDSANSRQTEAQQTLRDSELAISAFNQSIAELQNEIAGREQSLQDLWARQREFEVGRDASQSIVEKLLAAAYINGRSGFLKTLLNEEDSSEASRMLHYTRLFSEYQLAEIETYRTTINQLSVVSAEIGVELTALESQQNQLLDERNQLNAVIAEREQALAALDREITSRNAELERLEINRAELQALLEEIARAMSGIRSFADVPLLTSAQGELPAPIDGPILSRFGSSYGGGSLIRQGILIGAQEGTPVTAVHPGYVAFASWLQGQGLLVVLDHGEGFVSLYGGNQALAVEAGDWVARDQVIATSGRSTANSDAEPGLYFEIRQEGEPLNPSQWLMLPSQ